MAYLEYITCSSCGEHKQVVRSVDYHHSFNHLCGECWSKEQQKKKQDALSKIRDGKTLEERVAAIEEQLLALSKEVKRNSSFANMHTPIG